MNIRHEYIDGYRGAAGACSQRDPILSFLPTFQLKSARIGGRHPQREILVPQLEYSVEVNVTQLEGAIASLRFCISLAPWKAHSFGFFVIFVGLGSIFWGHYTLCFGVPMTLPIGFKVRVDSSSPVLFCQLVYNNLQSHFWLLGIGNEPASRYLYAGPSRLGSPLLTGMLGRNVINFNPI